MDSGLMKKIAEVFVILPSRFGEKPLQDEKSKQFQGGENVWTVF